MLPPAWTSSLSFAVSSASFATMIMSPVGDWKQTSPLSASIVILLESASNVILPAPVPSSMSSWFFSSSKVIFEP